MREIVNIEEFAKEGKKPPKDNVVYQFRVGKIHAEHDSRYINGALILHKVNLDPNQHRLYQKLNGGQRLQIEKDDQVDLSKEGLERFETIPLDPTEGSDLRQEYSLPEEDKEFLDSLKCKWEAIIDGGNMWVLIHDFSIPSEYNVQFATVAIQIHSGYPTSQLDMVYFHPWLTRKDGVLIGQADQPMTIQGVSYQRWSRHYQWQPGFHNLASHVLAIEDWLEREFRIKPIQGIPSI